MSTPYVYDAGVLPAIDGNDRRMWVIRHLALQEGRRLLVPAVVAGRAWMPVVRCSCDPRSSE